jgi:hypothetical protein
MFLEAEEIIKERVVVTNELGSDQPQCRTFTPRRIHFHLKLSITLAHLANHLFVNISELASLPKFEVSDIGQLAAAIRQKLLIEISGPKLSDTGSPTPELAPAAYPGYDCFQGEELEEQSIGR